MRNHVRLNNGFLVVFAMLSSLTMLANAYQQYITSSITIRSYGRIVSSIMEFPTPSDLVEPPLAIGPKPSPIIVVDSIIVAVVAGCLIMMYKCRSMRSSSAKTWGPIVGVSAVFMAFCCMAYAHNLIDEKTAVAIAVFTIGFRVAFYWATKVG